MRNIRPISSALAVMVALLTLCSGFLPAMVVGAAPVATTQAPGAGVGEERSITVTIPQAFNQFYCPGDLHIAWSSSGGIERVSIDLFKSGEFMLRIAENITNTGEHYWNISGAEGSDYSVRVSDAADPGIYDFSEGNFVVLVDRSVTVTSPQQGESFAQGSGIWVNWTTTGPVSHVAIDLWKGGSYCASMNMDTENDGSEHFASLPCTGSDLMVKVTELNGGTYGFSGTFSYAGEQAKSITVTYPAEYDYLAPGQVVNITWSWTGQIDEVRIDLFCDVLLGYDPSMPLLTIAGRTANTGNFAWTVPTPEQGHAYRVRVSSYDGLAYGEGGWFAIAGRMSFEFQAPAAGSTLVRESDVTISWNCLGMMQLVHIYLLLNGTHHRLIAADTLNDWSYEWRVPEDLSPGGNYTILVAWTLDEAYSCQSGELIIAADEPLPQFPLVTYVRGGAYNIGLPEGWQRDENITSNGVEIDVRALGPAYQGFVTNILVQSGKDITVRETESFLRQLIDDSIAEMVGMGYVVSMYQQPVFDTYSGHLGAIFSIAWSGQHIVQERLFVLSEAHSGFWFVTLSAHEDAYANLQPMFAEMASSFEITEPEPPLGGVAGMAEILVIVGVAMIAIAVGAAVLLLVMRRKRGL